MRLNTLALTLGLLCASSTSWGQSSSEKESTPNSDYVEYVTKVRKQRLTSEMFISTEWMPDSGVKLLGTKSTYRIWEKFAEHEKCDIPHIDMAKANDEGLVAEFALFQTEQLNLFVFEYHMSDAVGVHWVICDQDTKETLFESYDGVPTKLYFDGVSPGDSIFGGCGGPVSKVRFRKYTEEGPQLLEVLSRRCQSHPNYHETLFHIDTEFKEVPGARVDMGSTKHPHRSWRWWFYGKSYKPRKLEFNENGDATWVRKLYTFPYDSDAFYERLKFSALVERTCTYESANREVVCVQEELDR